MDQILAVVSVVKRSTFFYFFFTIRKLVAVFDLFKPTLNVYLAYHYVTIKNVHFEIRGLMMVNMMDMMTSNSQIVIF